MWPYRKAGVWFRRVRRVNPRSRKRITQHEREAFLARAHLGREDTTGGKERPAHMRKGCRHRLRGVCDAAWTCWGQSMSTYPAKLGDQLLEAVVLGVGARVTSLSNEGVGLHAVQVVGQQTLHLCGAHKPHKPHKRHTWIVGGLLHRFAQALMTCTPDTRTVVYMPGTVPPSCSKPSPTICCTHNTHGVSPTLNKRGTRLHVRPHPRNQT
mgnify:CR=1 FL=1